MTRSSRYLTGKQVTDEDVKSIFMDILKHLDEGWSLSRARAMAGVKNYTGRKAKALDKYPPYIQLSNESKSIRAIKSRVE